MTWLPKRPKHPSGNSLKVETIQSAGLRFTIRLVPVPSASAGDSRATRLRRKNTHKHVGSIPTAAGVTGFFDVCVEKGLTGEQGVLIPASNVQNLMLERRVVDAVRDRQFSVWAIETVDQGMQLLTGVAPGSRSTDGSWPTASIHGMVASKLQMFADLSRKAKGFEN